MRRFVYLIFVLCLIGCIKQADEAPVAEVKPLYRFIAEGNIPAADSTELQAFMRTVSDQPMSDELIQAWASSHVVAVFTPDVDSVFTDTLYVGRALGNILSKAENEELVLPRRRYATVVYGRPESVLFVDSVMLIALNHYLGANYPGYSHWPSYIRATKTPEALPYDLAEALVATAYPYALEGEDATALSRMIYEGVVATARQRLVAGGNPAGALGYTPDQMQWLADNEKDIWHSMVRQQLLYDTSMSTIDRLVAPSPATTIVTPEAPGRVGRYIGYRIVESYLSRHPEVNLAQMFDPGFYKGSSTLTASGF